MMCHSIGLPPISTMGLGRTVVSSLSREPRPPARITAFTACRLLDAPHIQPRDPTQPGPPSVLAHAHHIRGARREREVRFVFRAHAKLVVRRTRELEPVA